MNQSYPSARRTTARRTLLYLAALIVTLLFFGHFMARDNSVQADNEGNILKNGSFEDQANDLPSGWTIDKRVAGKGTISLTKSNIHSGQFGLKLAPNLSNEPSELANNPLGMGQAFPAGSFRGKKVYFSAWMGAEGESTALMALVVFGNKGPLVAGQLMRNSSQPGLAFQENAMSIPDQPIKYLVVVCVVRGTSGAAYFDDVFVGSAPRQNTGDASQPRQPEVGQADSGVPLTAQVRVNAGREIRKIPTTLYGTNIEWGWDGNGLWNRNRKALDPDLIWLTRELKPALLRFPGFSDHYHWRVGIGPQESRRATHHMAGDNNWSVHSFGTDEALSFADQVGGQLLITVNIMGTAQEAGDWVRYVNGKRRRVEYWEVGNENYITGETAFFKDVTLPPAQYAQKFLDFAKAMRAADPGIKIGAIGDDNYGDTFPHAYPNWTEQVLKIAGNEINFLAVHNGYAPMMREDERWPVRKVYAAMLAAPILIHNSLERVARKIDALGPPQASHIKIAVTEWGPYFQVTPQGVFLDHVKTLGSALYVASAMKAFLESPKTEIANSFKLNDGLFMGRIGKRKGAWVPTAPYFAQQMYTRHFGSTLVESTASAPSYSSQPVGVVDAVSQVPYLEVVSSRSEDGRTLYLMAINKHFDRGIQAQIELSGFRPAGEGTVWTLNGTGIDANTGTELFKAPGVKWPRQAVPDENPRFEHGDPEEVKITSAPLDKIMATFVYTFPAHSVTSLEIRGR